MKTTGRYVAGLLAAAWFGLVPAEAFATNTIRIATLAPKSSSWGKIFRTWEKAVTEKTEGKLKLDIYYNGVHGMEDAMVSKIKTGQLDGAVVSSVGLAAIYPNVLTLQLPGLLTDWKTLDRVRDAMAPELEKGFKDAGFTLLSWADVGLVRPFSTGFAVRVPSDIKKRQPLVYPNDPILPTMYAAIGGVVPTPVSVVEVLPALRTGSVNVLMAPGLAVEQLQWAPHLDHVTDWSMVAVIGGTILRTEVLAGLPADLRDAFLGLQAKVGEVQTRLVRKDDQSAYERVTKKMKVTTPSAAELGAWTELTHEAVRRLGQATFPRELVQKVAKLAGRPI